MLCSSSCSRNPPAPLRSRPTNDHPRLFPFTADDPTTTTPSPRPAGHTAGSRSRRGAGGVVSISGGGPERVSIDSATLSLADLTLLGDSFLRNGSVGLTRETGVPSSSAGSVLCTRPVAFRTSDAATTTASFAARFSFLIADPSAGGDGVAFFLSPDRTTLGATGGYLGLFNSSADAENGSIVAVEFDTTLNPEFGDPSDNHVGLDLGSPASVATADLAGSEIDLKSGNLTTAWIDYRAVDRRLEVFLSYAPAPKPARPVLSVAVDLGADIDTLLNIDSTDNGLLTACGILIYICGVLVQSNHLLRRKKNRNLIPLSTTIISPQDCRTERTAILKSRAPDEYVHSFRCPGCCLVKLHHPFLVVASRIKILIICLIHFFKKVSYMVL
jgi:hypothetical protein